MTKGDIVTEKDCNNIPQGSILKVIKVNDQSYDNWLNDYLIKIESQMKYKNSQIDVSYVTLSGGEMWTTLTNLECEIIRYGPKKNI